MLSLKVISLFVVIFISQHFALALVSQSVFADPTFGNDATGQLNNPDRQFKTLQAAINAAETQSPNPGNIWHVFMAPGNYFESPVIPDSVYVTGTGPDTFIFGTVTHTGGTVVQNVLILSTNAPGIIVNSTADVNYLTSVVFTTISAPSSVPITTVLVLNGEFAFDNGAMFATYSSTAPKAYLINAGAAGAGLVFQTTEMRLTVTGNIPKVSMYLISGTDKGEWSAGVSSITLTAPVSECIMIENNDLGNVTFAGTRIEILGNALNPAAEYTIAKLTGAAGVEILGAAVRIDGIGNSLFYLARGVSSGGVSPTFGIGGSSFIDSLVPEVIGSFQATRIETTDLVGSEKLGSGLYANIITVTADYTVQLNDFTVLVDHSHATITLPNFKYSKGRIVYVSNISADEITVAGSIRGHAVVTVPSDRTALFQNDGVLWNLLSL